MAKKLKDFFDEECVSRLASLIEEQCPDFRKYDFYSAIGDRLEKNELKGRVALIGECIYNHLPGDYAAKIKILTKILGPENPDSFGSFKHYFWQWPLSSVVEQYGLRDRETSLSFIYELTKRSTSEFALRPFLIDDPEYILKQMVKWHNDKNFHVRRLASEGIRPLLPWAKKFTYFVAQPDRVLTILKKLSDDTERYVQNSVANHMGDLVKLNYDAAISTLEFWSNNAGPSRNWVIRHALRNARKKGDQRAISLTEKCKDQ